MDVGTKNTVIHNIIMVCIGLVFLIYFGIVQGSPTLQKQIDENIEAVPIGQLLAYEGYAGYVILKQIRRMQEKRKLDPTISNIISLSSRVFHEYSTFMIDFIGITIITLSFFFYAYPQASTNTHEIMNISNAYFLIFVPTIGFAIYKLLHRKKLPWK